MLSFECDYNKGAHKKILERLLATNEEPAKGYGFDPYCASAAEKILKACERQARRRRSGTVSEGLLCR